MKFYPNQMFHIYNQGNNKRQLFYSDENYLYFLWKMRAFLSPFGDFVAWCLMPNHFHWLFYLRQVELPRKVFRKYADKKEFERRLVKYGDQAQSVKRDYRRTADKETTISFNDAIGDLQKSYTRAINKEKSWSGSLFRHQYKAKDGWIDEFVTVQKNGREDFRFRLGHNYGYFCFNYIHQNPVKAGLVKEATDYQWSFAMDYAGLRRGKLCKLEIGKKLLECL